MTGTSKITISDINIPIKDPYILRRELNPGDVYHFGSEDGYIHIGFTEGGDVEVFIDLKDGLLCTHNTIDDVSLLDEVVLVDNKKLTFVMENR